VIHAPRGFRFEVMPTHEELPSPMLGEGGGAGKRASMVRDGEGGVLSETESVRV
jgi:hypothetical protein